MTPFPSETAPRRRAAASWRLRIAAALAALLVAAAPSMAQESPNEGSSRGGGNKGIPLGVVIPLVAVGVAIIGAAIENSSRPPRRQRDEVEVRPGAKPTPQTSQQQPPKKPKPPKPVKPAVIPPAGPTYAADNPAVIVPGEVLFEIKAGVSEADVTALARRLRLVLIESQPFTLTGTTVYRFRILGKRPVAQLLAQLLRDPRVATVQPNHVYTLSQETASSLGATQYSIAKMRLTEAHATATGADIAVAVIDSGADTTHPALAGAIVESFDAVGAPFVVHPHGTAIAGLVASRGDLASPAPAAKVYAIRAFAGDGKPKKPGSEGTTMHIIRGIDWAAQRGVRVVNMSFAGPRDEKIAQFVAAGVQRGMIFVAAAGNAGAASPPLFPAADPNVIAVTATDVDDKLLTVANRGQHLAVSAPGVDVVVAAPGGGYSYMSGTSMASAEVAGVVALMVQAKPDITPAQARAALISTAVDLGPPGPDPQFGAGATDAKAAVDAVAGPPSASSAPPTPTPTPASAPRQ